MDRASKFKGQDPEEIIDIGIWRQHTCGLTSIKRLFSRNGEAILARRETMGSRLNEHVTFDKITCSFNLKGVAAWLQKDLFVQLYMVEGKDHALVHYKAWLPLPELAPHCTCLSSCGQVEGCRGVGERSSCWAKSLNKIPSLSIFLGCGVEPIIEATGGDDSPSQGGSCVWICQHTSNALGTKLLDKYPFLPWSGKK